MVVVLYLAQWLWAADMVNIHKKSVNVVAALKCIHILYLTDGTYKISSLN